MSSNKYNFKSLMLKKIYIFYSLKDAYETEILDFLSKEINIAQVFYNYVKLQVSYHEKMLAQINHHIPALEGIIGKYSINSLNKNN